MPLWSKALAVQEQLYPWLSQAVCQVPFGPKDTYTPQDGGRYRPSLVVSSLPDAPVSQPTPLKGPVSTSAWGPVSACAGPVSNKSFLIQPVTPGPSRETKAQEPRNSNFCGTLHNNQPCKNDCCFRSRLRRTAIL